ncbi:hypothetical protein [Pendulispora albinea]|uniref:Uncharacterized protein n=1 Tax=Pendulispora albinea TaxID=2741071 RepID=A0ABZ2M0H2_9BACT
MGESFFNVEDFIQSILVQLDRVQDALRLKAVNRPLTYALKDFAIDFHVFADLDSAGTVRFRPAAANETGASTLRLGFTTITKPMIEENTVSMAATKSPSLEEMGLAPEEVRRLEGLGVRTTAQLDRLQRAAGASTVSRWASVPSMRLQDALRRARPTVNRVQVGPSVAPTAPKVAPPAVPAAPKVAAPVVPRVAPPIAPKAPPPAAPRVAPPGNVAVPPRQVRIGGTFFPDVQRARFGDRPVDIAHATDTEIVLQVPPDAPAAGTLEIAFSDEDVRAFDVSFETDPSAGPHETSDAHEATGSYEASTSHETNGIATPDDDYWGGGAS